MITAIDVSLSMEADDVSPNRLEAAKEAAIDFVDQVDPNVEIALLSTFMGPAEWVEGRSAQAAEFRECV